MTDRTLFKRPPADGNLTSKQVIVLELLQANPSGLRAIAIGNHLHQVKINPCLYCSNTCTCKYAMGDAGQVLASLGTNKRELVIRRKSGLWELLPAARPRDTGELPEGY